MPFVLSSAIPIPFLYPERDPILNKINPELTPILIAAMRLPLTGSPGATFHVMSCHEMSCHVMSYHVMSYPSQALLTLFDSSSPELIELAARTLRNCVVCDDGKRMVFEAARDRARNVASFRV